MSSQAGIFVGRALPAVGVRSSSAVAPQEIQAGRWVPYLAHQTVIGASPLAIRCEWYRQIFATLRHRSTLSPRS